MRPRRRWLFLGLALGLVLLTWGLNISQAGTHVRGCPQECATPSPRRDGPLRVLTLNLLHGFPRFERLARRLDLIADEVRRLDVDIVCLQEVPWTVATGSAAEYLAERTGRNHLYVRANGNRWTILFEEGEAILSRYPLREAAVVELRPQAGTFEHRIALRATADTPWGPLSIVVTHLTHGDPQVNKGQAAALYSFVDSARSYPIIVAGDLNATPNSPQIEALALHWIDTYRAARPESPGPTCCIDHLHQAPPGSLQKRIDYLFLVPGPGQDLRIVDSQRVLAQPFALPEGWLWASDHVGLLTTFEREP
jgi:endonuclease/exonuclease/phosphatase family metal-dependent hydrolase